MTACLCCTQIPTLSISLVTTSIILITSLQLLPKSYPKTKATLKTLTYLLTAFLTLFALFLLVITNDPKLRATVFAKLMHALSKPSPLDVQRCETVGVANGRVLEIGPGPGTNFRCYNNAFISEWVGVDSNAAFSSPLADEKEKQGLTFPTSTVWLQGEDNTLPITGLFDSVVGTHVLCSVDDPVAVLTNIQKYLKPGGTYYFMEHVIADESTWTYSIQMLIQPTTKLIANGCTFRDVESDIRAALSEEDWELEFEKFEGDVPPPFSPHMRGKAVKK